jgi:predicted ribosome quality control (RQC) complex YloA/Tae2 family protein
MSTTKKTSFPSARAHEKGLLVRPEVVSVDPGWETDICAVPLGLVKALVEELDERLSGGRVSKVKSPSPDTLLLTVAKAGSKEHLLLSAHRLFPRLHLVDSPPPAMPRPSRACTAARPLLLGRRLERVEAPDADRIVRLTFLGREGATLGLILEFIPRRPNLFLLCDDEIRFILFPDKSPRSLGLKGGYVPPGTSPPPAKPLSPAALEAPSRFLRETLGAKEEQETFHRLSRALKKALLKKVSRIRRKGEKLRQDFERTQAMDQWRKKGELIKSALGSIHKGQRSVEVPDFFEPFAPLVTIELNPSLGPDQNMQRCFDRYKKLRRGREKIAGLLKEADRDLTRLAGLLTEVEASTTATSLMELAEHTGLTASPGAARVLPRKPPPPDGMREFTSKDGFTILVGRGAKDNDRLTFHLARGLDLWLHVSGVPGPHVLIRTKGGTPPDQTVRDAASLAVFFSKGRGRVCEVICALRKDLSRPRRGRPGLVYYSRHRSLTVGPDEERLRRLLGKDEI